MDPILRPDWHDPDLYAALLSLDRPGWAWEWLRRDPSYQRCALHSLARRPALPDLIAEEEPASEWGLHRFEDPRLAADRARPMWTRSVSALVLEALARPAPIETGIDLAPLANRVSAMTGSDHVEHILIADGRASLRIDLIAGSFTAGVVALVFRIFGPARLGVQIDMLRQFDLFVRCGRLRVARPLTQARARRLARLLRVSDALASRASQRTIASHLFSAAVETPRWRLEQATVRSQVQRLVRSARTMAAGGFWTLLSDED